MSLHSYLSCLCSFFPIDEVVSMIRYLRKTCFNSSSVTARFKPPQNIHLKKKTNFSHNDASKYWLFPLFSKVLECLVALRVSRSLSCARSPPLLRGASSTEFCLMLKCDPKGHFFSFLSFFPRCWCVPTLDLGI